MSKAAERSQPRPVSRSLLPRPRRTTQPPKGAAPARWLPQRRDYPSYQQWDTIHRLYQRLYALEDQLRAATGQLEAAHGQLARMQSALNGKVGKGDELNATLLNGLRIKATVPADGQKLQYSAKDGQVIWM